ncbi:Uncharacterized protein TCM_037326 [Theobroma cacao]|uniref:Uncharacterized protein n=1 Tax=Theobroma cacao TaxID=3641 RepID=A0A061GS40_THECC|nr:Uncharacterized protein TCM_037326 [Theobroma cacao]
MKGQKYPCLYISILSLSWKGNPKQNLFGNTTPAFFLYLSLNIVHLCSRQDIPASGSAMEESSHVAIILNILGGVQFDYVD